VITCEAGPGGPDGHAHQATIDSFGNGWTGPGGRDEHVHKIAGRDVLPTGTGHTHPLVCDCGLPRPGTPAS
jgi:hypothetical protein